MRLRAIARGYRPAGTQPRHSSFDRAFIRRLVLKLIGNVAGIPWAHDCSAASASSAKAKGLCQNRICNLLSGSLTKSLDGTVPRSTAVSPAEAKLRKTGTD